MTETRKLDQSLRSAREVFAPSSAAQARVRAALAARLATAGSLASAASTPAKSAGRALALAKGSVILGVGFALGFWTAGARNEVGQATRSLPALAAPSDSHTGATVAAPKQSPSAEAFGNARDGGRATNEALAARAPETAASGPPRSLRSASPGAKASRAETSARRDALGEELALLQRAERAIRAGDGALARSLIEDLDSRFEHTTLREERAAVLALAACTLGEAGARREAREFLEQHPNSVYFARIQTACALDGFGVRGH